ncbi:putative F-box domain-containing protein [Tanacetum coccineum]
MSDHIPFDLQVEIIKKLPTESLLKFRAVSKQWKCLINSAKFIADYNPRSQHLFIHSSRHNYHPKYVYLHKCVKVVDDDTLPQHKFSLTVPSSCVNMYRYLIGYSHGLFCLFGHNLDMAVIWNPSIRKSVDIVVPNLSLRSFIGFGVCRDTNDLKIVKINEIGIDLYSCEVEVFTLSSGLWRRPVSKLPDKWFRRGLCLNCLTCV